MGRFRYLTKSRDEKMSGVVSSDFIARALLGRSIQSVSTGEETLLLQLNLSDGGSVRIKITPESPEVHYYSPSSR